jgi:hypothetical protein
MFAPIENCPQSGVNRKVGPDSTGVDNKIWLAPMNLRRSWILVPRSAAQALHRKAMDRGGE